MTTFVRSLAPPFKTIERWIMGPAEPRAYGAVRVAFAITAGAIWIDLWPLREMLFAASGSLGPPPAVEAVRLNWFQWVSSPGGVTALFVLTGLAIVSLGFGVWQRVSAAIVYLWFTSYSAAASIALGGFDTVARLTSFAVAVSPTVAVFALELRRRTAAPAQKVSAPRSEPEQAVSKDGAGDAPAPQTPAPEIPAPQTLAPEIPVYGLRILQWQLMLIYWVTFWLKSPDRYWRQGEVISHFGVSMFARNPDPAFADIGIWDPLLTWGTLLIELTVPVLLWKRSTRWLGFFLGLCLHGSIAIMGKLALFSLAMLPLYLAFLEREDFDKLECWLQKLRTPASKQSQR